MKKNPQRSSGSRKTQHPFYPFQVASFSPTVTDGFSHSYTEEQSPFHHQKWGARLPEYNADSSTHGQTEEQLRCEPISMKTHC